ncbi:MAG: Tetratricopeptide 2 repeat protein, partial [Verrucomicrobiales bacterium]|nr:Tetratricopeptide 2 repeat protein [Verrucomicrobiales bacterium]
MKFSLPSIALSALVLVTGCATTEPTTSHAPVVGAAQSVPAKDLVLWEYRDGVSHLRKGEFADAKRLLDEAITTISGIRANDKNAKKARGYFHKESKKTFLGEPYERVMAYFYRGILYWMDGEPDNARACFRSAQLEDSDAEEHTFKSDYVLLDYLDGLASVKLSQDGADAYKRACELAKGLKLPPYDTQANVLVFVEFGNGPEKYAAGEYGEELRFRDGHSVVH